MHKINGCGTNDRLGKLQVMKVNSSIQTNKQHQLFETNAFVQVSVSILPYGEYTLKWIGTGDICFERPVSLSVSSAISCLTAAAKIQVSCTKYHSDKQTKFKDKRAVKPDLALETRQSFPKECVGINSLCSTKILQAKITKNLQQSSAMHKSCSCKDTENRWITKVSKPLPGKVHKLSIFPVPINPMELQHQRSPGDNAYR
jgi:hypothetical protein